jgi:hypothetical protein
MWLYQTSSKLEIVVPLAAASAYLSLRDALTA